MTQGDEGSVMPAPVVCWVVSEADRVVSAAFDRPFELLADPAGMLSPGERSQRAERLRQAKIAQIVQASLHIADQPLDEAA